MRKVKARRDENTPYQFNSTLYLDADMLVEFVGGLDDGLNLVAEVRRASVNRTELTRGMKAGVDQFFELAVGASKSSEQGSRGVVGVKQHTLESIFSRLFNPQDFKHKFGMSGRMTISCMVVSTVPASSSASLVRSSDAPMNPVLSHWSTCSWGPVTFTPPRAPL